MMKFGVDQVTIIYGDTVAQIVSTARTAMIIFGAEEEETNYTVDQGEIPSFFKVN